MAQERRVDIPALLLALIHQIAAKERSRGNPFAGFRIVAACCTLLGPCYDVLRVEGDREDGRVSRTLLPAVRGSSGLAGQVLSPVR